MKNRSLEVIGFSLLVLSACQSVLASSVFSVSSEDPLIINTLPAIRQACPGLDKYSQAFENIRVEDNFRTSVVFDVQESNTIPEAYKASGHTCYIEVDSKGKNIFIEKLACKSICLDQMKTPDGQLKIDLAQRNG